MEFVVAKLNQKLAGWANYFRVNVLLGESVTCLTVAHSFFLQADSEGRVLESSPELVQRYGPLG